MGGTVGSIWAGPGSKEFGAFLMVSPPGVLGTKKTTKLPACGHGLLSPQVSQPPGNPEKPGQEMPVWYNHGINLPKLNSW